MLVEKIETYLNGSDQRIDKDLLELIAEASVHSFTRQFMEDKGGSSKLRGSNPGPCPKKMAYAALGFEQSNKLDARAKMTFLTGDLLEVAAVALMKLANINVTDTVLDKEGQLEGFFEVGNGLLIGCHGDGKVNPQIGVCETPHLLEVKSASDHSFKRGYKRGQIGDQYMLQHQVYLETFELEHGVFFLINKNTGHFHEIVTSYDADFVEWGRRNYEWAGGADPDSLPMRFSDGKDYGRMLDKDGNPTERIAWGCRYCSFSHHCWEGLEISVNKRGTVEGRAPKQTNEEYVGRFGVLPGTQVDLGFEF